MGRLLKKFVGELDEIISAICLILVVIVTVLGVVMRYFLNDPLTWTEELMLALLVWFTFLGSSAAFKDESHVSIDFFTARLPKTLKKIATFIWFAVITAVVLFVFLWLGSELAMQAGEKVTTILRIPYTFIDISVVLGGLFMLYRLAVIAFKKEDNA